VTIYVLTKWSESTEPLNSIVQHWLPRSIFVENIPSHCETDDFSIQDKMIFFSFPSRNQVTENFIPPFNLTVKV